MKETNEQNKVILFKRNHLRRKNYLKPQSFLNIYEAFLNMFGNSFYHINN